MKRVDLTLVELGLAPTRTKAQAMVRAGEVEIFEEGGWRAVTKPSERAERARINDNGETLRYVSRGGLKLKAALDRSNLEVRGWRVLDVGQSTGGFTDCLLQAGAEEVLGVDVGHDQLHPRVRQDARVTAIEGVNARALATRDDVRRWLDFGLDLVVADLSFISITSIIPVLAEIMPRGTLALALIKPQFEAGPEHLNRRGICADEGVRSAVLARVLASFEGNAFGVVDSFPCEVKGQDGNQEFFALVRRT